MVLRENIDKYPYTGVRNVKGKLRIKTHEEADWLDGYFNGTPHYNQVKNVTRGKIYDVVSIEGFGDCEAVTIINDIGEEQHLSDFFFAEIE